MRIDASHKADLRDDVAWHELIRDGQAEAAVDGVLTVGADGVVLVANRAFRELWQLGDDLGRPGSDVRPLDQHIAGLLVAPGVHAQAVQRIADDPRLELSEQLVMRDGREVRWTSRPIVDRHGTCVGRVGYYSDITRLVCAERDALANEARTRAVIEGAQDAIVSMDDDLHILDFNRSAAQAFGWDRDEVLWRAFDEIAVESSRREDLGKWLRGDGSKGSSTGQRLEVPLLTASGKEFVAECTVARRDGDAWVPITLFARDVSLAKRLEAELRQAQKLESVGRLASGIAHEINTPVQYVGDSLYFVREAMSDLVRALVRDRAARRTRTSSDRPGIADGLSSGPPTEAIESEDDEDAEVDDLIEQVPKALDRALQGLERVAALVRGMKEFAQPDLKERSLADLNRTLQTTLDIAHHEYASVADVETDFGPLPPVSCALGEMNQAFLNIIVNAAHAVGDVVRGAGTKGTIRIRTWHSDGSVFIAIGDTGNGVPEAIREKIFDPFFTTKAVGSGAGQGLTIARTIVVDKHHGELTFDTEMGRGTTFTIRLPVIGSEAAGQVSR
jgi:PAS domain S-box-containing protein